MEKEELKEWVLRKLGYPMVRVELHDSQLEDCLKKSRDEFIKWASGNVTDEVFFTMELSSGINEYELPAGVTEVVKVKQFDTAGGGINTLFSVQNYLYNTGVLSFLDSIGTYGLLDYHLALDFIDTLDRYIPDKYIWRHNKHKNTLILKPTPVIDYTDDNIGYIMIHSYMVNNTNEDTKELGDDIFDAIWGETWVQEYSLACAKETLGMIRRKFENFSSIGNEGINLDGESLISEGKEEKEKLEERLRNEEPHMGMPIIIG